MARFSGGMVHLGCRPLQEEEPKEGAAIFRLPSGTVHRVFLPIECGLSAGYCSLGSSSKVCR